MRVTYQLSLEDHLAWFDYCLRNNLGRGGMGTRLPILGPFFRARRRKNYSQAILAQGGQGALGERSVELSPSGVREFSSAFDFSTDWQNIEHVVTTAEHVFLAHPSLNAHIIPQRCFESEDLRGAFVWFARKHAPQSGGAVKTGV